MIQKALGGLLLHPPHLQRIRAFLQQLYLRFPQHWMYKLRGNLAQGNQREPAVVQLRMGDCQERSVHQAVAVVKQVEVDEPFAPMAQFYFAQLLLYRLQGM